MMEFILEVYYQKYIFGDPNFYRIPIPIKEDSKSLVESIYSTKKVQCKTMRVVIPKIQEQMINRVVRNVSHISSKNQLGDVFRKKGVSAKTMLELLEKKEN